MAFFACGTRDKPYIRPLRPGTFLYRYSFWAGLASTTSSKVNKPASNFRRSLAERKSWRAELCPAFGMGAPRERAGVYKVYREFRTSRRALNVLSLRVRTVRACDLICLPPGGGAPAHLHLGWVLAQWQSLRFCPPWLVRRFGVGTVLFLIYACCGSSFGRGRFFVV